MASLQHDQQISSNSQEAEPVQKSESREGSVERKVCKDRDEKLKLARERQNEERQRKIEELKAQAEAAQRYREQKEEERRRRIDEIRSRDSEKRHQVEERKRAIMEAEKERREYILRKNQERESRLETKKRERNSIGFAFGSSTPRLLDPDFGLVSPSTFWGQRRSTSISNVAGASLSRRSSERELADSGAKKRATSASGTERHDDHRRSKSSSMYEVFNWGYINDEPPKRFSLSIVGSEINIDEPPRTTTNYVRNNNSNTINRQYSNNITSDTAGSNYRSTKEDNVDTSQIVFRSVARRKTDLMPTIPTPRDGHYGSRSSLSHTPRTPVVGRAYSMNRLDQLAQPIRRNGEHIRAIIERERREQMEMLDETESLGGGRRRHKKTGNNANGDSSSSVGAMSRSMSHLAGVSARAKYSLGGGISSSFRPLASGSRDACKSMSQLTNSWSSTSTTPRSNLGLQTTATKKYLQSSLASPSSATKRGQQHITNTPYRFDPNSLLLMNTSSFLVTTGSRSGNVTPGGSISTSRPGSAMSTSTNISTSGLVPRRSAPAMRKPRPASIAGTGVSLEELNKHKREYKPPVKNPASASSTTSSAQNTPKRTSNMMSTSLIVTSSSRLSSAEKKTPAKREPVTPKSTTPKSLSKTNSSDRLHKLSKEKPKDLPAAMVKSAIVTTSTPTHSGGSNKNNSTPVEKTNPQPEVAPPAQSKDEKNALNAVKTEVETEVVETTAFVAPPSAEPIVTTGAEQEQINKTSPVAAEREEKVDQGNEKDQSAKEPVVVAQQPTPQRSKEGSLVRELTPPSAATNADGVDMMTASMIARKITTEEQAKAALAERRRKAREEAERQAELERQRLEAERLAEIKRQEEEAERQRLFEEESMRLAAEQRRAEEERLRQAIEEATQREEEERLKREDEERQRVEREEAEKKAKEEAEKQRIEVAERLKREEKEREERRKRVEAIMSRTRKAGAANTPNSTPVKENNDSGAKAAQSDTPQQQLEPQQQQQQQQLQTQAGAISNSESSSTSGSSSTTTATTPTPLTQSTVAADTTTSAPIAATEPQNSQAMYEQSVIDKETALINSFSNMIIDENAKNLQQQQQQPQPQIVEVTNGKMHAADFPKNNEEILQNATTTITTTTTTAVANGNGHIENINNKNDINAPQDIVVPATNQLIDFMSLESQSINNEVNLNNNNSLTTTTLVTVDSHENKDISLL